MDDNRFPFGTVIPDELRKWVVSRSYTPRSFIVRAEEPADEFFYIVSGRIQVFYLMENSWIQTVRFYSGGDIMGDLELFQPDSYSCFVQALSEVTCLAVPMERLREYLNSRPDLLWRMGRSVALKLQESGVVQAVRMRYPLKSRLAYYLVTLEDLKGKSDRHIREMRADSLTELSHLMGCSYRHLTRTLREMEESGLIRRIKREILLTDPGALRRLSESLE